MHEQFGTNKIHEWSLAGGDVEAGFAEADVVVERRVVNHRIAGAPIEPRGVLADYRAGSLTVWSSTQVPHFVRLFLALLLGLSEDRVRVIAPEVGGGFGSKLQVYGEESAAAGPRASSGGRSSGSRPAPRTWRSPTRAATRSPTSKMGAKRDGTITAFHVKIIADFGAYNMLLTPLIPSLGAFVMGGCYKIPAVQTDIVGVFTNKCPTDAIRGAGRPEATHMIEVDARPARRTSWGWIRWRSGARTSSPRRTSRPRSPTGVIYDSGDYDKTLDRLLEHVDVGAFRAEQEELREQGIYRGIGFCTYTEICGLAPVADRPVPRASGVQAGCGSRRWSASTTPARSPSTPAPRPTARATRRRSPRSSPTGSASTRP